jgi:hypothetical protein
MRRLRLVLAGVLAVSSLAIVAPAAQAQYCAPDDGVNSGCQCQDDINRISRRLTGQDLIACPM